MRDRCNIAAHQGSTGGKDGEADASSSEKEERELPARTRSEKVRGQEVRRRIRGGSFRGSGMRRSVVCHGLRAGCDVKW